MRHGIERGYYESGALEWTVPYENGNRHGLQKGYSESGAIRWTVPYENGKRMVRIRA
jgi:antitoxin component YwqK of YwqJK toxin-antitoxin module